MPDIVPNRRPDRRLGPQHNEFWAHCAAGELRLQRCDACGARPWPVVAVCERCQSTSLPFQKVRGEGEIVSWTTFERDYFGGLLPIPWETILVRLDEGPMFISNPKDFDCSEPCVGTRVKVAFIDAVDSAGAFRLPVFERI